MYKIDVISYMEKCAGLEFKEWQKMLFKKLNNGELNVLFKGRS